MIFSLRVFSNNKQFKVYIVAINVWFLDLAAIALVYDFECRTISQACLESANIIALDLHLEVNLQPGMRGGGGFKFWGALYWAWPNVHGYMSVQWFLGLFQCLFNTGGNNWVWKVQLLAKTKPLIMHSQWQDLLMVNSKHTDSRTHTFTHARTHTHERTHAGMHTSWANKGQDFQSRDDFRRGTGLSGDSDVMKN